MTSSRRFSSKRPAAEKVSGTKAPTATPASAKPKIAKVRECPIPAIAQPIAPIKIVVTASHAAFLNFKIKSASLSTSTFINNYITNK